MFLKRQAVSVMLLVSMQVALALCVLTGCALQRDEAGAVNDPNFEWVRVGFSVKAPSGGNWYRLPDSEKNHSSSVTFQKAEGVALGEFRNSNIVYIKGSTAFAASTFLEEPVLDRKDNNLLTLVLRRHLEHRLFAIHERLDHSSYETLSGADCLKYDATSSIGRIATDKAEMKIGAIHGYFCLHPALDDLGIIVQTSEFATVWTDIQEKENSSSFFEGVRFLPISSSVYRSFTKRPASAPPAKSRGKSIKPVATLWSAASRG